MSTGVNELKRYNRLVNRDSFAEVVEFLLPFKRQGLDTETTGLRPYHGDRLFSIIHSVRLPDGAYAGFYFDFQEELTREDLLTLNDQFYRDPDYEWVLANAKYDQHILWQEGVELVGPVQDVLSARRVIHNDYKRMNLDILLSEHGFRKDDTVKKFLMANKLYTDKQIPTRKDPLRVLHYDKAPKSLLVPYGCWDSIGTLYVGDEQKEKLKDLDQIYPGSRHVQVYKNEQKLIKTVYRMERTGFLIDQRYCEKGAAFEEDRRQKAAQEWKRETGRDLKESPKLFAEVFKGEKWLLTKKGNPSFAKEAIEHFQSPLAAILRSWRDAEFRRRFYLSLLYHADSEGRVHANFNPYGADTGRFTCSDPNGQNFGKPDKGKELEFELRRAIIPTPGFVFIMPDYDQIEYRMFLDYAAWIVAGEETEMVRKVKGGLDVHQATADTGSVTRDQAKTVNFLSLYGGGEGKLALDLKTTRQEAKRIQASIFDAAPELKRLILSIEQKAKISAWIRNWYGRVYHFGNRRMTYKAPNKMFQGGAADVMKVAMTAIDEDLSLFMSRMVMCIHDELVTEVHESEVEEVPKLVKERMEAAYPYRYLPLTVGMQWSNKSLMDKVDGFPV